jgi:hypothetical protein
MSIAGISAASSAAYLQQSQNAIQSGTTATATTQSGTAAASGTNILNTLV